MNGEKQTPYIEPNLSLSPSYEKALQNYKDPYHFTRYLSDEPDLTLSDVLERQYLFIIAEPGQGKTRLLNELKALNSSARAEEQTIILDLKNRSGEESLEAFMKRSGMQLDPHRSALILLDALDEVAPRNVISTIEQVKTYKSLYPLHKIYVSCRIYFFSKYEYSISGFTHAEFLLIEPLENRQSRQFLKSIGVSDLTISSLFSSLKFIGRDGPTVLNTPRYLEMLAQYVKANPELAKTLNRADLFEAFVSKSLQIEDTKNGRQLGLYKKRFLEKLALTMEIAQVNSITEDDLLTFIDEAKSDLKMALINQIDIEDLYEHSLLKKTDQEVSFDNAEIQEYLAAKGILRLNDPIRCVFDVAIEPNLREPLPSWSNTLSFIIDEIPSLAVKLLNIKSKIPASEDEAWHRLVTGSTSPHLGDDDKVVIFHRVWDYYCQRDQTVSSEISFRLSAYMPQSLTTSFVNKLLKHRLTPKDDDRAQFVNLLNIIGDMSSLNKIDSAKFESVKDKLVNIALKSKDKIIQHNALNALREFKDPNLIDQLFVLVDDPDQLIQGSLQGLAYDIDKNHPKSVEIFAAGIREGRSSYSRIGIEDIDEPKALTKFLEIFSEDKTLIKEIVEHNRIFIKDDRKFLSNVVKHWQPEWLDYLKKFVLNANSIDSGYYGSRSELVTEVMKMIAARDKGYFAELLDTATKDDDLHLLFSVGGNLAVIMQPSDLGKFDEVMKANPDKQFRIFDILLHLPSSKNHHAEVIEQSSRKTYADLYKQHDEQAARFKKENQRDRLAEEFEKNVKDAQDKDPNISGNALLKAMQSLERNISDESTHKDQIKYTEEQVNTLWEKAKERFLDVFDPATTDLKITDRDKSGVRSYTMTRSTQIFQVCVRFGYATKRPDLAQYRSKLIALIPYAYYAEQKAILATLDTLDASEKKLAIAAYTDSASDAAQFLPDNLVEISEKFAIKDAVPILDEFVGSDKLHDHIRKKALEISDLLQPSKTKLEELFKKYSTGQDIEKELSLKANELLITKYKDRPSILWRIQYVKDNPFEYVDNITEEFHPVGVIENEIHEGHIVKPLKNISEDSYIDNFIELLNFSFELVGRGITWHNYASYIWAVVDQYFNNLVSIGKYEPIDSLEKAVELFPSKTATASYIRHLSSIKRTYLDTLGKPKSFASSIQRLNDINANNYLPIASNRHLYEVVSGIIEDDLHGWISGEGRQILKLQEVPAQPYIFMTLKSLFQQKGFTKNEILVLRESQAIDGTKTDFLAYYGFYGPIVVELKRSGHQELQGKTMTGTESYKSLKKYMAQFNAEYGVLLVYETETRTEDEWQAHLLRIREQFTSIKGVEVIGIGTPNKPPKQKATK